ncbi:hypothetical protein [Clostridium beijerinckii]|uniref:hypothetical protein n=1 Tax=Clostridium beijerinckii TaxID=1520 RepID=UPI0022E597CC|nr:hypothetical protein [Clostridium beijerinckii]
MKKTLGAFMLGFGIISLLIIAMNYTGHDDKCIILIGLNPILNEIVYIEPFRTWLDSGIVMRYYLGNATTLNMYLAHTLTFLFYGFIFGLIKCGIEKVIYFIYHLIKNNKFK